jgi:hypothetical protein
MDLSFNSYSTLLASTAYSLPYFSTLSFQEATGINYPTIAPRGSVVSWFFVDEIPLSQDTIYILPDDCVPHIEDLLPIICEAEKAFSSHQHAVYINICTDEVQTDYLYHFSKVSPQHLVPSLYLIANIPFVASII